MIRAALRFPLLFHLVMPPPVAIAQDSVPPPPNITWNGTSLGATVDRYLVGDAQLTAVSFRGVVLAPRKWSPEFGFGLLWDEENHGWAALTMDLGIAHNVPEPGWMVLPKVGTTGIYGLSGNGAAMGAYAGIGVLGAVAGRLGIRAEVTRRWYLVLGGQPAVWLLSVGLTSIPLSR